MTVGAGRGCGRAGAVRAVELGARYYVVHSGHHMGSGVHAGRRRVAACVREALLEVPGAPAVLLENTAGGGSGLGANVTNIQRCNFFKQNFREE